MQIPSSAGAYTSTVLPVAQTQGGLLSPMSETAGSASFPPVEAVPNATASRDIAAQRPLPDFSPENNGLVNTSSAQNSSSSPNASTESGTSSGAVSDDAQADTQSADPQEGQEASQQSDRINDEIDQKQARQDQQQQQDLNIIRELTLRDNEVRAHEQAHSAVGGQYAGSANYTYQRGPDGVNYAVGGEVPIDVGVVAGDPQATLEKMMLVQRAALAPAEPSSQDRQVAALASQQANQARAEIASESLGTSESVSVTSQRDDQNSVKGDVEPVLNTSSERISSRDSAQIFNDRIAKINEVLVAISQNDASKASGQLLDAVV